jgi:hypothetical protein
MKTLFASLTFLTMAMAGYAQEPVFYWDMETNAPNIHGTDSTVNFYANAVLSDSAAYAGTRSFRNQGEWAQGIFNNPTTNDEWCPISEGSFEFYWRYVAPWDGKMIFQIGGKDVSGHEDTNDGIGISLNGNYSGVFGFGMGWLDSTWHTAEVRNRYNPITMVDGQWYRFRLKYKVGTGLSMQIDDGTPFISTNALGRASCTSWHWLGIGNDTYATGVQYIDEFKIWSTWLDAFPGSTTIRPAVHTIPASVRTLGSSPRPRRTFTLDGRVVRNGLHRSGVYLTEINGTVRKTLFIDR